MTWPISHRQNTDAIECALERSLGKIYEQAAASNLSATGPHLGLTRCRGPWPGRDLSYTWVLLQVVTPVKGTGRTYLIKQYTRADLLVLVVTMMSIIHPAGQSLIPAFGQTKLKCAYRSEYVAASELR